MQKPAIALRMRRVTRAFLSALLMLATMFLVQPNASAASAETTSIITDCTSKGAAEKCKALGITQCDVLAADLYDPDKPSAVSGVPIHLMDANAAISQCLKGVAEYPDNPRQVLELGRAYYAAGQIERSERLFREAADRHYRFAEFLQVYPFENHQQDPKAFSLLQKLASSPDGEPAFPLAINELAKCYYFGRGTPKDVKRAVKLFSKSAGLGLVESMVALSEVFALDPSLASDPSQTNMWWNKALATNKAEAIGYGGIWFLEANPHETLRDQRLNEIPGLKRLRWASDHGFSRATVYLARYLLKTVFPRDRSAETLLGSELIND